MHELFTSGSLSFAVDSRERTYKKAAAYKHLNVARAVTHAEFFDKSEVSLLRRIVVPHRRLT